MGMALLMSGSKYLLSEFIEYMQYSPCGFSWKISVLQIQIESFITSSDESTILIVNENGTYFQTQIIAIRAAELCTWKKPD